jgi:hypothetical protein
MNDDAQASLPQHLLELAEAKGLAVERGAILFESDIGGGLLAHTWLTQQESGVSISSEILVPIPDSLDEYEELLPVTLSRPVDEEIVVSIIERWGALKQLEVSFDAQLSRTQKSRPSHDSGLENDNLE